MKPDQQQIDPGQSEKLQDRFGNSRVGFFGELWTFLKTSKKWWMIPIVLAFLLFAGVIILSSTGVAPFIYTLF